MPNPFRGDSELVAGNKRYTMRLTLGALAEIEDGLGLKSLGDIAARSHSLATSDIAVVASALLRGGGHNISADDVMTLDADLGAIVRAIAGAFQAAGLHDASGSPSVHGGSTAEGGEGGARSNSPLAGSASRPSASA